MIWNSNNTKKMPRGRRRAVSDDESDSDLEVTQATQASRTQNRTKSQRMTQTQESSSHSNEQLKEYVRKVVKIALQHATTKLPVKRAELVNEAMNGDARIFASVLQKARQKLGQKFQMDFIELRDAKVKQFICVSKQPAFVVEEFTDEQLRDLTLLYLILEYIYMKNGEVGESTLYEYLARFEIHMNEDHEYFGDVKQLVRDDFVKQQYLSFVKHVAEGTNVEK